MKAAHRSLAFDVAARVLEVAAPVLPTRALAGRALLALLAPLAGILALALAVLPGVAEAQAAGASPPVRAHVEPGDRALVARWLDGREAELLQTYEHLHANPELSQAERETAAFVARALTAAGYRVTPGVGGTGVVGVLENGEGPVVLIRGDMDALPVTEATGLRYASRVRTRDADGALIGVMHACGHDVHTTALIGIAELMASVRDAWRGTLVILAQPAEELGLGAKQMIDDGLFERFPLPDYFLSLHVEGTLPAGSVGIISGFAAANVDSVDILVHGRGGHGARPNRTIDPIVAAAHMITVLQTIVSRRVDPVQPAVVTVGSIHGGSKRNVIPDDVRMQLTVRSYSDEVRSLLLDSIRQIATDTCRAFECPEPPEITVNPDYTPAMYNDPELTAAADQVLRSYLPADDIVALTADMGGEDFGRYSRKTGAKAFMLRVGSVARARFDESQAPGATPLPSLHSSRYAPDPVPTLRTGIGALSHLALSLLARP